MMGIKGLIGTAVPNDGRVFTEAEYQTARALYSMGKKYPEVAAAIGRPEIDAYLIGVELVWRGEI